MPHSVRRHSAQHFAPSGAASVSEQLFLPLATGNFEISAAAASAAGPVTGRAGGKFPHLRRDLGGTRRYCRKAQDRSRRLGATIGAVGRQLIFRQGAELGKCATVCTIVFVSRHAQSLVPRSVPGTDFAGAEGVIPLRAGHRLPAYAFTPEKICLRTLA
jgi:hypothetical protein